MHFQQLKMFKLLRFVFMRPALPVYLFEQLTMNFLGVQWAYYPGLDKCKKTSIDVDRLEELLMHYDYDVDRTQFVASGLRYGYH